MSPVPSRSFPQSCVRRRGRLSSTSPQSRGLERPRQPQGPSRVGPSRVGPSRAAGRGGHPGGGDGSWRCGARGGSPRQAGCGDPAWRLRQVARGGAGWGARLGLFTGLRAESCRCVPCPTPPARVLLGWSSELSRLVATPLASVVESTKVLVAYLSSAVSDWLSDAHTEKLFLIYMCV